MVLFILRRLWLAALVCLTVLVVSFILTRLSGDLAASIAGPNATAADVAIITKNYGLDRPLVVQFLEWAGHAAEGDLGRSFLYHAPVWGLIRDRLPITLTLGLTGLAIALLVALPLGILAAVREGSAMDRGIMMVALLGQAMPGFWFGLVMIVLLGLDLQWLPISGVDTWQGYIMPGIVLAFSAIPALMRLTRSGMIDALAADYIRTARAKGLSRAKIVLKHALRNAAMPVVSIAAVQLGFMLGGSVVIESVFALPGVGYLAWESITKNDFPVVQAVVLFLAVIYIALTVLAAIFAPYLVPHDPFAQDLNQRLIPPVWMEGSQPAHLLGTDQIGRDYLSRLIYGTRISMLIGVLTVITSGLIGITLGIIGGFYGGRTDDVVMFLITCRLSIPLILVALTVVALVGSSLAVVILTLGLLLWDRFAVVARTTTMQVRNLDYIAAAQAAGASRVHVLVREVLPNIANHLVVVATLEMALAILLEAALSFLGLGVPPPLPSWGLMIAEAKEYMFFSPLVIMTPGVALFVLVLGINLLGDGLRDMLGADLRQ